MNDDDVMGFMDCAICGESGTYATCDSGKVLMTHCGCGIKKRAIDEPMFTNIDRGRKPAI
jgi:transcription initiation factor TFIIIB Brf1 subunit/transcription initiation factor TFIIB